MPGLPSADGRTRLKQKLCNVADSVVEIVQCGNKCLISSTFSPVGPLQMAGKQVQGLRQENVCNCGYESNRH
jgi:hypothetical protein